MDVAFIDFTDSTWKNLLGASGFDFYHLPEYVSLAARYEGGEAAAFYARDRDRLFFAPLLMRSMPDELGVDQDWRDATSPYGYPTPLLRPADDLAFLSKALTAFVDSGRVRGLVSAFFRLHPLIALPVDVLGQFGDVQQHGVTVSVDLQQSEEALWKQIRENHRRNIRKQEKAGYRVVMDDWSWLPAFISSYESTMARVGAHPFYYFEESYYEGLKHALGDRLHLCTVLSPEGEVAAGGLFTSVNGMVQYHLGGTHEAYLRVAPTKLMFYAMILWAKRMGYSVLHLGGGVGAQADSLFHFKLGFSKKVSPFFTFRMILDQARYMDLVQRRGRLLGDNSAPDGFFPQYRSL